jgi:hypothetical protein
MKINSDLVKYLIEKSKTNDEIKKHCDEFIKKKQHEMMLNPKVYVAKTKDPKTDLYYLNCKLFLPIDIDKTKEVKVYIGKMLDFPNGCNDVNAKRIGEQKMREKLKKILTTE